MAKGLDDQIARVSAELNRLRQRKLEELKHEMLRLEGAGDSSSPARRARRVMSR